MLRAAGWQLALAWRGVTARWRETDAFATLSPGAARREMGERLLAQLRRFAARPDALPEWREAARAPHAEALWEIWPSLPVLTKRDLQTRFHPRSLTEQGVRGRESSTGGSTGEPTPFLHDPLQTAVTTAMGLYAWRLLGWRPGMPVVGLWGAERDIGKQRTLKGRLAAFARGYHLVDGYALDDRTVERVLRALRQHRQVAVYGFTSMLEFLARAVLRRGDSVPPGRVRAAWNGGEMLFPEQSALFRQAFGVPLLNLYGGRELGAMAVQKAEGAPLRVLRPWLHLDVLDDAGRPAAPGKPGRLVWTSTVGGGTPFLRYEVGDLGAVAPGGVDESGITHLAELHGRQAGLITLPGGRTINGLYWNHLFKEFPEVEQFQVALIGGERLELRLRGAGASAEREQALCTVVDRFVGGVPLAVRWMDRIPLTAQGKLIQVVRE